MRSSHHQFNSSPRQLHAGLSSCQPDHYLLWVQPSGEQRCSVALALGSREQISRWTADVLWEKPRHRGGDCRHFYCHQTRLMDYQKGLP